MRSPRLLILALLATSTPLVSQSSQFGVRGLGFPGRALSARAIGSGGAAGMFEGEDARNPASLATLQGTTISFNGTSAWRTARNPISRGTDARDTRFPVLSLGGRIPGSRLALGVSQSLLADRDYTVITEGVAVPRGEAILYTDTLRSRGGISDLRIQGSWQLSSTLSIGAGADFLTGQNQLLQRRVWADTAYLSTRVSGEVSNRGLGVIVGALYQLSPNWQLAGSMQWLGDLEVQQDSLAESFRIPMPVTLTGATRILVTPNLRISGMATLRDWGRSNAMLLQTGGSGASSTSEVALGLEWARNARDPTHLPLRLGARLGSLPFPLEIGSQPREWAVSLGTGLDLANHRGGLDLALERVSRQEGSRYSERAWQLTVGVTVRAPGGN